MTTFNKFMKTKKAKKNKKDKTRINLNLIKPLDTIFDSENVVPIAFASSDFFAPYLGVTIQSIIDCSDSDYNYDLVVFTKDMSDFNKQILSGMCDRENFSIRFVNVKDIFEKVSLYTPAHITIETYFRLVIPKFMQNYHKILFLDSDLLIREDVKNLYHTDLTGGGYALAAAEECLMSALVGLNGQLVIDYMKKTLKLKNVDKYFQAGVIVLNTDFFNSNNCCAKLMNMVSKFNYNIVDQDAMNELLNDKCYWLPNEWNYPPLQKHMKKAKYVENMSDFIRKKYLAVKEPKIIHFADWSKPWWDPTEDYAPLWWNTARKTSYYEIIISNMIDKKTEKNADLLQNYQNSINASLENKISRLNNLINIKCNATKNYRKNKLNYIRCRLLQNLTFGKTRLHYMDKKHKLQEKLNLVKGK